MHTLLNTIKNMNQSSNLGTSANMTKLIAESIFKDLKSHGFADKDIVAVSSEILNKLTDDLRNRLEKK
ncbi:hypothetical protein [Fluviispira vulneris]|uniref:hypothetical protein n=1 Tax=Fluviispira vulneris TaxID=2763012 RepID=UPI001646B625|nr:hypothetical protein [Fluviispira vulneris]